MILGKEENIKLVKNAKPPDKTILVSWESIEDLPKQFDVFVDKVEFDPREMGKFFTDVSKKGDYYPKVELFLNLGNKSGIRGCGESISEPIVELIDISNRNMTDIPNMVKMTTGYSSTRTAEIQEYDGTWRPTPACIGIYSAWIKSNKAWATEESFSEGYTKPPGKYEFKYNTKYKRKKHFWLEMEHAQSKSETKAYSKCIRELLGMQTGFKTLDLKCGYFIVAKIVKSKSILNQEALARLENLKNGGSSKPNILFANEPVGGVVPLGPVGIIGNTPQNSKPNIKPPGQSPVNISTLPEAKTPELKVEPEIEPVKEFTLLEIFQNYKNNNVIPGAMHDKTDAIIKWLKKPTQKEIYLPKVIEHLRLVENDLGEIKLQHKFY